LSFNSEAIHSFRGVPALLKALPWCFTDWAVVSFPLYRKKAIPSSSATLTDGPGVDTRVVYVLKAEWHGMGSVRRADAHTSIRRLKADY